MRDLGICLGPTCVNVRYKAEDRLITEEDFLGQGSWLLCSMIRTSEERSSRERKEMHPLKNKIELHYGCQDPRSLLKRYTPF